APPSEPARQGRRRLPLAPQCRVGDVVPRLSEGLAASGAGLAQVMVREKDPPFPGLDGDLYREILGVLLPDQVQQILLLPCQLGHAVPRELPAASAGVQQSGSAPGRRAITRSGRISDRKPQPVADRE